MSSIVAWRGLYSALASLQVFSESSCWAAGDPDDLRASICCSGVIVDETELLAEPSEALLEHDVDINANSITAMVAVIAMIDLIRR